MFPFVASLAAPTRACNLETFHPACKYASVWLSPAAMNSQNRSCLAVSGRGLAGDVFIAGQEYPDSPVRITGAFGDADIS
jgi:hypothetical protein